MKGTIRVLGLTLVLPLAAFAEGNSPTSGRLETLSAGVSGIRSSIADGDFSNAASGLGGLFDDGGGAFDSAVVDGRESGAAAESKLAEFSPAAKSRIGREVPAPAATSSDEAPSSNAWGASLLAAMALTGGLMLARAESTDPDHRRDGGRSDNPSGDRDVQEGIERNRRAHENRQLLKDPVYRRGFEDGRNAQEAVGAMEGFLNEIGSN